MLKALKQQLKKSPTAIRSFEKIDLAFRWLLFSLSPEWLAEFRYYRQYGRLPDLKNPVTFDEKLLWLMLHWRVPLKSRCADKYAMRSYVEDHELAHLLPGLLGVYDTSAEINFDTLPDRFVLKCTRGSGFNIICRDKNALDRKEARGRLEKWMRTDISRVGGEVHYSPIRPRIIAEEFLIGERGDVPNDYKIYCFGGIAHCTMACTQRQSGQPQFDFYDRTWAAKLPYSKSSLRANRRIAQPASYDQMLAAAEVLSRPFPFVRMDFYDVRGRPVIGEMTFTPNGCIDKGFTDLAQRALGALVALPEKRHE